jgi:hypothetical protein
VTEGVPDRDDLEDIADGLEREIAFLTLAMRSLDNARVTEDDALRTARGLLSGVLSRLRDLRAELRRWTLDGTPPEPEPEEK